MFLSSEQIAFETARYRRYRHCVIFPVMPIRTLTVFQKVYLLSLPTNWYLELSGQRVAEVLASDLSVDCLDSTEDMFSQVVLQLEKDVISGLQVDMDCPLAKDQLHHLLTVLSSQRHALRSLVDSTACHELPIGSVQLPILDVFADIVPCLTKNAEHELPRDEYRFWQLVDAQVCTDELGREIVRSQTLPTVPTRPCLQEYLRYLEVDETLPSLISKSLEASQDTAFYTHLGCVKLAPGQAYEKFADLL